MDYPILGIDEVGRGCGAGPLFVAGVLIKSPKEEHPDWKDSKLLKAPQRRLFSQQIQAELPHFIHETCAERIDQLGILHSVLWAMGIVVEHFLGQVKTVIVDGSFLPYYPSLPETHRTRRGDEKIQIGAHCLHIRAVEKADSICKAVSAASIVAKVARDELMEKQDQIFPGYGFGSHKGYFTKSHTQAIHAKGLTKLHRRSFRVPQL